MTRPANGRSLRDVVVVDAVRTPFGRAGGVYAGTRADDLIVRCLRELIRRNPGLSTDEIEEVAIAATTQTGDQGLTLGRSAGLLAGLPRSVPGYAIDRMCAGALTAVTTTAGSIAVGAIDVALAGGVEHMGHHPMGEGFDPNPRFVAERLVDPSALVMGQTAENLHDQYPQLSRERADAFALASQQRYATALAAGDFEEHLVPMSARAEDGGWTLVTRDEQPRPDTTLAALAGLRTPFRPHGRVTAGNAAGLNDGATAALLMDGGTAQRLGLRPKLRMVSFAFTGVPPETMGYGPVPATHKALAKAGLGIADLGLIEINEAFAVQVLAFADAFGLADDDARINPYGGAIAIGHPLAASGVRLMAQLAHGFERRPDVRYGLTTMCVGLGMGASVVWENPHHPEAAPRPPARQPEQRHEHGAPRGRDPLPQPRRRPSRTRRDDGPDHPRQRGRPSSAQLVRCRGAGRARCRRGGGAGPRRRRRGGHHRQALLVLRGRRRDRHAVRDHARTGAGHRPARPRGLRTHQHRRQADLRLRQRSGPRRWPRTGAALPLSHGRDGRAGPRSARGLARPRPRLGRGVPAAEADRRREGARGDGVESPAEQPASPRPGGLRARDRGCRLRAGGLPRAVARVGG